MEWNEDWSDVEWNEDWSDMWSGMKTGVTWNGMKTGYRNGDWSDMQLNGSDQGDVHSPVVLQARPFLFRHAKYLDTGAAE